ncbi:hypothetical protein NKJ87_17735 [Mesorhizobium sp. M0027]|uniref:hypothetical protein n=3 Tax=Mesorhizobium TaxID=68287 RepID=UPI0003FB9E36|nr:hypothetical protein [Mesorhizobium sp. LSHC420B00]
MGRFLFVVIFALSAVAAEASGSFSATPSLSNLLNRLKGTDSNWRLSFDKNKVEIDLERERAVATGGVSVVGVATGNRTIWLPITAEAPSQKMIKSNRGGSYFLDDAKKVVFGTKINIQISDYAIICFNGRSSWIPFARIVDEDGRESRLRQQSPDHTEFTFTDALRGPHVYIILDGIPAELIPDSFEIVRILNVAWPGDPTALLPDTDSILHGTSVPSGTAPAPPIHMKYDIPKDFVDLPCVVNDPFYSQFNPELATSAASVGLIRAIRWSSITNNFAVNFCTGFLTISGTDTAVATSALCVNGSFGRGISASRPFDAKIYWDYANTSCSPSAPLRWELSRIQDLPSANLPELVGLDTGNDIAILRPTSPILGRQPLALESSSDPAELLRATLHHSDLRPLLATILLRYAPADPDAGPTIAAPPPCLARSGREFAYALEMMASTSSAQANGSAGAPLLSQTGKAVGVVSGICQDVFQDNTADFSYSGRPSRLQ